MVWLYILIAIILIFSVLALRILYELHTLRLVKYTVYSEKIKFSHRVLALSDLHGRVYGPNNRKLIEMAEGAKPEIILIAGDLVTFEDDKSVKSAEKILHELSAIAPVYYLPGNHEQEMEESKVKADQNAYKYLMNAVRQAGVHFLKNKTERLSDNMSVSGFSPEMKYFPRFERQPKMPVEYIDEMLGEINVNRFNILLAHHPAYFKTYVDYEADLVISGHYHGGVVRFSSFAGLISPQFKLFPAYFYGRFRKRDTTMIVTAGCGSHKVNIRLNNMPELVAIDIRPPE